MEWHPTDQRPGESGAEWCRQRPIAAGYAVEDHEGFGANKMLNTMDLRIELFTKQYEPAARAFNQRMRLANAPADFLLPECAPTEASNRENPSPVAKEQYIVLENETVRGGFILQKQEYWVQGGIRAAWNVQAPLSEGIVDRKYNFVALWFLETLQSRNPLIYSVGMGSSSRPYPRLLKALKWYLTEVPFFFRICNATRFFREIQALRTSPARRIGLDMAALSGLAAVGIHTLHAWKTKRPAREPASIEPCPSFEGWADEIWNAAKTEYSLCGVRTQAALNCLYPKRIERLSRFHVRVSGTSVGWAVVQVSPMHDHKYFGDLRLGVVVDCMATQKFAHHVLQAAAAALEDCGVDLIVSNQSHAVWICALQASGFLSGPSNFLFGASPKLKELACLPASWERSNINRGDGDGMVNL